MGLFKRKEDPAGIVENPSKPKALKYSDSELLERTDEFNRHAETYWQDLALDASGRRHVLSKPFSDMITAPNNVCRLGILLAELKLGVDMTVLDFGAGSCWLASCLNLLGCRTVAIDISPAALELGKELFRIDPRHRPEFEPRFLSYDGHRIPLPDESVDRIVCFDAFHHIPNQDEVLAEMYRVLIPGGRVVMAEPGQGYGHAETAVFDEEQYGVLENELDPIDVETRALARGFSAVTLKPYPPPSSMSLSAGDFVRFINGDVSVLPMETYQHDQRDHFNFTLKKGEHRPDSRCPNAMTGVIRLKEPTGSLAVVSAGTLPLLFELENTGDTLWLHRISPFGGFVALGVSLMDAQRKPIKSEFMRATLARDVRPKETLPLLVQVPLPEQPGRYVLRFDLVSADVAWFGRCGSLPCDVEVEVISQAESQRRSSPTELRTAQPAIEAATVIISGRLASIECLAEPPRLESFAGDRLHLPLRVTNHGPCTWPFSPVLVRGAIRLGAQLLDESGQVIDQDYGRGDLPAALAVHEAVTIDLELRVPKEPGPYRVRLDMLQEEVCWFSQHGSIPVDLPLIVNRDTTDSRRPGLLLHELQLLDPSVSVRLGAGSSLSLRVRARNRGNTRWLSGELGAVGCVALGGHLAPEGRPRLADYFRARLSADVAPGEETVIEAGFRLPDEPGRYRLEIDLVDEGLAWFSWDGSQPLFVDVDIVSV